MSKAPHTAHEAEPRTLGGRLPRILADVLAHDRAFLDTLDQKRPLTIEGTVTAVARDNTGSNKVRIQRTGQPQADATWYVVWGAFQIPVVGDRVRLLLIGKGAAVIVGAKHGGRPNEWTVAYTGGALHQYDSGRNHIHKHGDDHHHRHYQTDGTTIAHHHSAAGHHAHQGDHIMGGGGGLTIGDTGTASGTYHKKTHNAGRYEHYQGTTLVRHHNAAGDHGHYSSGSLIHNIVTVGTAGGRVRLKQHNTSNYHLHGDDGAGNIAHVHGTTGQVWGTNGSAHTWYTNSNANGVQPTLQHIAVGAQAGQLRVQQNNTFGSYHYTGDDGAGNHRVQSASADHYINLSGGAAAHRHHANGQVHPSGAYHDAPSGDSSVINTLSASGSGAIKRASHATTPQVVGTGSATITTDNNIAHYQWPSGAPGDPHLKLIMACVWDSGLISNPGFYNHIPACAKGSTKAYGAEVYNTSGGGTNSSYVWGTQALANDSQAWIYATQLGGAGNKTVGTALWAHIIS